jgi:hypothetical protein
VAIAHGIATSVRVQLLQAFGAVLVEIEPRFAQQHVRQQTAAHANLAVDAPDRQLDAFGLERFAPGEHMLVHAVHERAVQIEHECGIRHSIILSWF